MVQQITAGFNIVLVTTGCKYFLRFPQQLIIVLNFNSFFRFKNMGEVDYHLWGGTKNLVEEKGVSDGKKLAFDGDDFVNT